MSDKLIEMYTEYLGLVGLGISEEGLVIDKGDNPVRIGSSNVAMPIRKYLNTTVQKEKSLLIFHPGAEDVLLHPSIIVKLLIKSINNYLNHIIADDLLRIAMYVKQVDLQSKLDMKGKLLLRKMPVVSATDLTNLAKIIKAQDTVLIKVALPTNRKFKGDTHTRLCTVKFPLYEKLTECEQADTFIVNGIKVTKKSIKTIRKILSVIFENIENGEHYYGTGESTGAPSMEATTETMCSIAADINKFSDFPEMKSIDTTFCKREWFKDKTKLMNLIAQLPIQKGNKGSYSKTEAKIKEQTVSLTVPEPAPQAKQEEPKKEETFNKDVIKVAVKPAESSIKGEILDDDPPWDEPNEVVQNQPNNFQQNNPQQNNGDDTVYAKYNNTKKFGITTSNNNNNVWGSNQNNNSSTSVLNGNNFGGNAFDSITNNSNTSVFNGGNQQFQNNNNTYANVFGSNQNSNSSTSIFNSNNPNDIIKDTWGGNGGGWNN